MKFLISSLMIFTLCSSLVPIKLNKIHYDEKCTVNDFMLAVAYTESRCRIDVVNTYGMLGKYQFSRTTLNGIGFKNVTTDKFLKTESIQDSAMLVLMKRNQKTLSNIINEYSGKIIKGINITESGILASAHLAGAGSVRRWFKTHGNKTRVDGYGTSIESYMKKFANYEIDGKN